VPPQGWLAVIKRAIRKRTRWHYAGVLMVEKRKQRGFRAFVRGCRELKRLRLLAEVAARKALMHLVDREVHRARRAFMAMHAYAQGRIAKRRRREELVRKMLHRMAMNKQFAALEGCVPCRAVPLRCASSSCSRAPLIDLCESV
jgi:hypothetical protein